MANWSTIGSRGNVEDRRRFGPTVTAGGGIGVVGLLVYAAFQLLSGGDAGDVLSTLNEIQIQPQSSMTQSALNESDNYQEFASTVLGSANDAWSQAFRSEGETYKEPKLVLFRGATQSACRGAVSEVGPHYCPLDQTIYLDETFFQELTQRFHAKGGDVAEAYVIAHEVGHHVQEQLGLLDASGNSRRQSIATELQADCFAGMWAYSLKDKGVFEPNEIQEALDAAAAVGDDRIQSEMQGEVHPETWTHGSSQQRVDAFMKGYNYGALSACTF